MLNVTEAVRSLPPPYLDALQLVVAGGDERDLAQRLDIPAEAAHAMVRLAVAKLAALLADPSSPQ